MHPGLINLRPGSGDTRTHILPLIKTAKRRPLKPITLNASHLQGAYTRQLSQLLADGYTQIHVSNTLLRENGITPKEFAIQLNKLANQHDLYFSPISTRNSRPKLTFTARIASDEAIGIAS